ncbi:MAG TPA: hypothetical protein VFY40_29105, partial [Blastocatellia bacterium]|nr:hypothetical protein [Blastocatellia bacterium]
MNSSLRDLLSGLIDYAGLFPPAALDMASAARKYAEYRGAEYGWALGRFVAPVARLDEFEKVVEGILPDGPSKEGEVWRLSALGGADLSSDLNRISEFNLRRVGAAAIDAIEIKAARPSDVENAMKMTPLELAPYFEIPIGGDPTELAELIETIAETE